MTNKIKIEYAVISILVIVVGFQFFQINGLKKELKTNTDNLNLVGGVVQQIVNFINQNQPK